MPVLRALERARLPILTVALTYLLSIGAGAVMVHRGNAFAIAYRDKIVSESQASPSIRALDSGERLRAAVFDFGGNLLAVTSNALGGLGVIIPYPFLAYRGWIGGIVSIDSSHASRLGNASEATYYLVTLLLQVIPSVLGAAAGINLGMSYYRPKPYYQGGKWLGLPKEALRDAMRIYALVVPLLLAASLWEFLLR